MLKKLFSLLFVCLIAFTLLSSSLFASHNDPVVEVDTSGMCGETVISAFVDPTLTHKPTNMYLVLSMDGDTQSMNIPVDGSSAELGVGPFYTTEVETRSVQYRVFGGGERDYDFPAWNGYGGVTFAADITAYSISVGGHGWVLSGPEDPNPFTTWAEVEVETCALTKDMCKDGGWESFSFRNQGLCIQFVNTGFDSRIE